MEVSVEDDHPVATRVSTGETNRRRGRLGARVHEPHPLTRRHALSHRLGEFHLAGRWSAVGGAGGRGLADRGDHGRMGMTEDDRPVTLDEVDVLVSLDVPDARALGSRHHIRTTTDRGERADRRVDPTRDRRHRSREHRVVVSEAGAHAQRRGAAGRLATRRIAIRDHRKPPAPSANHRVAYDRITSAPARRIEVRCSSITASPSTQPRSAAACTIAYSPLT